MDGSEVRQTCQLRLIACRFFPLFVGFDTSKRECKGSATIATVGQQANANSKPVFNLFFSIIYKSMSIASELLMEKKHSTTQITIDSHIGLPEQLPRREQQRNPASFFHVLTKIHQHQPEKQAPTKKTQRSHNQRICAHVIRFRYDATCKDSMFSFVYQAFGHLAK